MARRLSACHLLALLGMALCWCSLSEATYTNSYTYIKVLENQINLLEQRIKNGLSRLGDAEGLLTGLAREECQNGKATVSVCPGFDEASVETITLCVTQPIAGAGPFVETFDIPFNPPFSEPPVVDLTVASGLALIIGKNCSVELDSVSNSGLSFTFIADGILPIEVEVGWFACPSAAFGPSESLPKTSYGR